MTKSKDEKKQPSSQEEPDFEKLYYQAMKENMLLRDDKIALTFTTEEINLLRSVMFEELLDARDRWSFLDNDYEDDDDEKKILNKRDENAMSKQLIAEKRQVVESIIKKLRFEI